MERKIAIAGMSLKVRACRRRHGSMNYWWRRGWQTPRARAKALVLAGKVRLGTERLDKPGRTLPEDVLLTVLQPPRFVSRGGEKLEGFLDRFGIDVAGLRVLDVGASTGGFTDCCLQRGRQARPVWMSVVRSCTTSYDRMHGW